MATRRKTIPAAKSLLVALLAGGCMAPPPANAAAAAVPAVAPPSPASEVAADAFLRLALPATSPHHDDFKEKYGRSAVLQINLPEGDACLYTSNGGSLANRRLAELVEHNLTARGALSESVSPGGSGQSWRVAGAGRAIAARVTRELDVSEQLFVLRVRKASLPPPLAAPPPPPPLPR